MANFNKVILMGNLTREPELRVTPGGLSICKFGLAVNRFFTDREGNKREETTFVDIDSFGRQAETISKYMSKGRPILVEGRLKLDRWETPEGEKRSRLGIVLEHFQFVGGRDPNESRGEGFSTGMSSEPASAPAPAPRQDPAPPPSGPPGDDDVDEDVPF